MPFCLLKTVPLPVFLSRVILVFSIIGVTSGHSTLLSAQEQTDEKNSEQRTTRSMEIRVCDENGKPLQSAKLFANVSYFDESNKGRIVISDLVTNAAGRVTLNLPLQTKGIRLWASKADYVSEFVILGEEKQNEQHTIPDHFDFQLARGSTIGGIIVDKNGKPIPDVKVDINVAVGEPDRSALPKPTSIVNTTAVTDKAGKWSITTAPGKPPGDEEEIPFRLKISHQDYISDSRWGELQNQQYQTIAMLREGSSRIVMQRGFPIQGTVLNTAGDPVTQGIVVWNDSPYFSNTVNEVSIDESGQFKTISLPPGKHPVTVVAPGFMPVRQLVEVNESLKALSFSLKPGKTLRLKIVDPSGKPIPKAYVSVNQWRGAESLYNVRHSNVLNSNIPNRADAHGVYVWDWAPADPVTYQISGKSCAAKTVTLLATEKEHLIQLDHPLTAVGKVTDAQTGKPVKEFRVIPVIEFSPKFLSTTFDQNVTGKEGQYKITLNQGMYDRRHFIRIEAEGYRSALSESSFGLGEAPVTQNFSLEPAPALEGIVVDQSGKPVADAMVLTGTPSIVPIIQNGKPDSSYKPLKTSAEGRFQIAATFEPMRIRVVHKSDFAEIVRQPDEEIGTITLRPAASISGTLLQSGEPLGNQWIHFDKVRRGKLEEPRFQDSFSAKTDAQGRFDFKNLPPVAARVYAYLGPWLESPLTSSQSVPLNLEPGDHKTIELGNQGTTVSGTVTETGRDEAPLDKKWSLNYLIRRDHDRNRTDADFEPSFDPTQPLSVETLRKPDFFTWLKTQPFYIVKLTSEGQMIINGVPPGTYDLMLTLYEPPAGCLVNPVGVKRIPVTIKEQDLKSGQLDLGTLSIPCKVGPQPGSNLNSFQFTDTSGHAHTIYDLKGRYILLHAWASWCVPCIQHMPEIEALTKRYPAEQLTLIGLNADKDTLKAQDLLKRKGWKWTQHFLETETERARKLTVSSVPLYYLVGPGGLVTAVETDWHKMQNTIERLLNPEP